MTPDDIERANQRLAGAESFTVTPAKYLGHYVTAVLAARHDIKVTLQGSVVVGIAAEVEIPAALITEPGGAAAPSPAFRASFPAPNTGAAPSPPPGRGPGDGLGAGGGVGPAGPGQSGHIGPSAADVREAVERLRTLGRPRTPALAPPADPDPVAAPDLAADTPLPGWARPVAALPPGPDVGGNGHDGSSRADGLPERTASGLVRRVRGAHVPMGAAVAQQADPSPEAPPAAGNGAEARSDGPSSGPVDGSGIQTFLSDLVGGVQRSLDGQASDVAAEDEVRDAH
jgi:hypothetical protein